MNFKGDTQMENKYLASDWLQNKEVLINNMNGTYTECYVEFGKAVETDVDTFEGVEFPAEPVLVEDIVTSRMNQMYRRFVYTLGSDLAKEEIDEASDTDGEIWVVDSIIDELNEALEASDFYKEWCKEHKGARCYVGYWDEGIGFLMDADA